jgi:undecaprenyl-diphosphatase
VRQRKADSIEARMAWLILIATIPGAVIGYLFEDTFERLFASPLSVALLLIVTGAVLVASDVAHRRIRRIQHPRLSDAILIGFAQAAAIAPGLSRSGLTIAAGVFRGLTREAAARFSFLLSVPIIVGAGLAQIVKALEATGGTPWFALVLGFASAAVSGYLAIRFLLRFVQRHRLWPFAAYCWLLAAAVLIAGAL